MKNPFINILGWIAVISLLSAYALLTFSFIDTGVIYQFLNLLGAIGLGLTALYTKNYQSLVVQIFWACIGIAGLLILVNR